MLDVREPSPVWSRHAKCAKDTQGNRAFTPAEVHLLDSLGRSDKSARSFVPFSVTLLSGHPEEIQAGFVV